jgi:uncharacterized Zn finger protein (UPF0148 family)
MDLPDTQACPDCGVLLRDGDAGLECPACGHTIAYDAVHLPEGVDTADGIRGG